MHYLSCPSSAIFKNIQIFLQKWIYSEGGRLLYKIWKVAIQNLKYSNKKKYYRSLAGSCPTLQEHWYHDCFSSSTFNAPQLSPKKVEFFIIRNNHNIFYSKVGPKKGISLSHNLHILLEGNNTSKRSWFATSLQTSFLGFSFYQDTDINLPCYN